MCATNVKNATKKYYFVYFILVTLTLLTCVLSLVPQVGWHATVGLGIASLKAGLIAVFFMHILTSDRLPWLALVAALFWISILFGLTLTDYLTRVSLSY
jgi:cytochrome c oxidase subunit 4